MCPFFNTSVEGNPRQEVTAVNIFSDVILHFVAIGDDEERRRIMFVVYWTLLDRYVSSVALSTFWR